jgi:hypothetical protein
MACGRCPAAASISAWAGRFVDPSNDVLTDFHGIRILYRVRVTGGELRDEVGGSSDTCRWVTRAEVVELPIVELVRTGLPLAFGG